MLKKILVAIALAFLLLLAIGLFLPQGYTVSRSVLVHAGTERIHPLLEDLTRWPEWAPWEQGDKTLQKRMGSTTRGVGASQSWSSASGAGRLTITSSDPARGISYDLVFVNDGHESPAHSDMSYAAANDGTVVTWSLEGEMDMAVLGGWFALLADRMMGPMFDQGLQALRAQAERTADAQPDPRPDAQPDPK